MPARSHWRVDRGSRAGRSCCPRCARWNPSSPLHFALCPRVRLHRSRRWTSSRDGPADALATRHVDPDGVPAAPVPFEAFAEKSSEAADGCVPQAVPRLTSVGTPGDASAVEHVEAKVGSSAEPTPASEPANEPVTVATAVARISESVALTLVWLASASTVGPDVVAAGTDPSGADGCDADPLTGTPADVPGPVAVVEPCVGVLGPVVLELVAVIGSLDATVAGPALPPLAEVDPPMVELWVSGRMSG